MGRWGGAVQLVLQSKEGGIEWALVPNPTQLM